MTNTQQSVIQMEGKVCLVTGATSGIGKVAAKALATQGATVVVAGRNLQKAQDTVRQIQSETGNHDVHYLLADFADLKQVEDLAGAFKSRFSRLHVLVNDAGAVFIRRQPTPYGVEKTLLVNHLAHFLLTNLLLDLIRASAPSRIVIVASAAHVYGELDLNDLQYEHGYNVMNAYGRSKLANILFTYELARRLEGQRVAVNAVHPGQVATDIWKVDLPVIGRALKWFMGRSALTPEEGADTVIYLATSLEVEGISGKYYVKRQAVPSSRISYDESLARRLWQESERLTNAGH